MTFFYVLWFARNRVHGSGDYCDPAAITEHSFASFGTPLRSWTLPTAFRVQREALLLPSVALKDQEAVRRLFVAQRLTEDKKERHEDTPA